MNPVVDRVRKLIALAGSPNANEGRSAALLACRLIREHQLTLTAASGDLRPRPPRSRATTGPYRRSAGRGICRECGDPIDDGDGCTDTDGLRIHGDCIPAGERP